MSSGDFVADHVTSEECRMCHLASELKLEIFGYLDVHDQRAMGKVWKAWRSSLSQVYLSKYVSIDVCKLLETFGSQDKNGDDPLAGEQYKQALTISDSLLEDALRIHVEKNTKVLVIRDVDFNQKKFATVARCIRAKDTDLIQLIVKDCEMPEACHYRRLDSQVLGITLMMLLPRDFASVARKLVMDNYTIRNILSVALIADDDDIMRNFDVLGCCPIQERLAAGNMFKKLPIIMPRLELDLSQPFHELYRSFAMALEAQCPPVSSHVREDVAHLGRVWAKWPFDQAHWLPLSLLITSFNGMDGNGDELIKDDEAVSDAVLQQLDPLTLNNLTIELLHRMYCLPNDGTVHPRPMGSDKGTLAERDVKTHSNFFRRARTICRCF